MMTNIFSVFDPSSSSPLTNWISLITVLAFIPMTFWFIPSKMGLMWKKILITLHTEFKMIINLSTTTGVTQIIVSIFLFILINNLPGLLPYIFTSTSHMTTTLSMSVPMWLSIMLFGWMNTPKSMLAHLIPQNTPVLLMPFMVLIETISNIIRPLTLSVRLTANLMAGHLLLTLLGNQIAASSTIYSSPMMAFIPVLLLILELAVAMIQSYVFSILITLYVSEI